MLVEIPPRSKFQKRGSMKNPRTRRILEHSGHSMQRTLADDARGRLHGGVAQLDLRGVLGPPESLGMAVDELDGAGRSSRSPSVSSSRQAPTAARSTKPDRVHGM